MTDDLFKKEKKKNISNFNSFEVESLEWVNKKNKAICFKKKKLSLKSFKVEYFSK